jgi:preprotein translocase subunit SecY
MAGLDLLVNVVIVATGSVLLMWIGELITEFGIGNGTSLIIFAGIVSVIPSRFIELVAGFTPALITVYAGLIIASVLVIIGVVAATEAERAIPVTYAKQSRGGNVYGGADTYIPFRLNQAGVIPIIFALSILVFPQMLVNILSKTSAPFLADLAFTLQNALTNPYIYGSIYFVLVVLLTFFYTSVTFEPVQIAEDLQKRGAFIPGVRPGEHTVHYLSTIVTRITLIGALFLGIVAVLPVVIQAITGNSTFAIGGTALLIVVSVVLDLIKKVDAQAAMREY